MFEIPSVFGQPVYVWSGMFLGVLVIIQVMIAKKWLPVKFIWHRRNGWLILAGMLGHGILGIAAYIFHVKVQGF